MTVSEMMALDQVESKCPQLGQASGCWFCHEIENLEIPQACWGKIRSWVLKMLGVENQVSLWKSRSDALGA